MADQLALPPADPVARLEDIPADRIEMSDYLGGLVASFREVVDTAFVSPPVGQPLVGTALAVYRGDGSSINAFFFLDLGLLALT